MSAVRSGASNAIASSGAFRPTTSIALQRAAAGPPVERVGARRLPGLGRRTRRDRGEDQPDGLARLIAAARNNRERIAADREFPRLFHRWTLRVSEIVEPIDHLRPA